MKHVLIDGYNLGLEKGTGVATYARNLSYEVGRLGHRTSILYGQQGLSSREPLLREIGFFDSGIAKRQSRLQDLAALVSPLPSRGMAVPVTGRVVTRQFAARLPHYDTLYNAADVFRRAHGRFQAWGSTTAVQLPQRPDLAHWTYPLPLRVPGAVNLFTVHDLVPLRLPYTTLDNKRRYLALLRTIARTADHLVTVSECSRRDIIEITGIAPERVTNTYQAVDIPAEYRATAEEQVAREVEGAIGAGYKDYFLFWGSIEPKKNIGRIVEAYMASGLTTPLVIVGAQAWRAEGELRLLDALANGKPAKGDVRRGRVIQLPYAPFGLLVSLIRGAKAALFPSLYEGFGLPVLEAMLLGTPVLCSNTSSLPEVAGDAAIAVDPYDTAAIAAGLRALDADAGLRADLTRRGHAQAAHFSPERYRARLAALYERFL
ncbi:glycosyltransferase family 4 protein [Sphingomonas melonis]|uniref:Glycosyltransferase involved in cell wall biosynthesis n=1 Tax=Sphingomonas melonis TaxID=152682 RepID=A0A7Y9K1T0_9SPHN|nr:glycosyltransferase family 1 protein [Sphingomonas melonis]NYD91308.1 glycosyltransferase involved in cell wall biosynthesis [Sphingomonas melonis]